MFIGSEPVCIEGRWSRQSLVLAVLVVPIGMACWSYLDAGSASLAIVIMGQVGIRKACRLSVMVDPKINAFLILEKARTGGPMAKIVEDVFRECIRIMDRRRYRA